MSTDLSPEGLRVRLAGPSPPLVIDVRKPEAFRAEPATIPGAIWRDPAALAGWSACCRAGARSWSIACMGTRSAMARATRCGARASSADLLAGGLSAWQAAGGEVVPAGPRRPAMKWVTRARPVIDRIACPWLIVRFIDDEPEFLFVPPAEVQTVAARPVRSPSTCPGSRSPIAARAAASTALSRTTSCASRPCTSSPGSCAAPTPSGSISRRSRPACWRSRRACARASRTTTPC